MEEVGNDHVYQNRRNTSGESFRRSTFTPHNRMFSPYVTAAALSTGSGPYQRHSGTRRNTWAHMEHGKTRHSVVYEV